MPETTFVLFLDFDGTVKILPHQGNSTWSRLDNAKLSPELVAATAFNRRHFVSRKQNGLMTEEEEVIWLNLSVHALVESRLHRDEIGAIFAENGAHLRPGFHDFLRWAKRPREGVRLRIAINSYGFVQVIDHILRAEGVRELVDDIVAMDMVFDADGYLTGYDPATVITAAAKGRRSAQLLDRHGIPYDRAIGIGDSDGDAMIVPDGGKRLLLAFDDKQADHYRKHFHDVVVSPDWSGPQAWLARELALDR